MKKCAIPLSEPLVYHRPEVKWFKEVDVFGGGEGVSSQSNRFFIIWASNNNPNSLEYRWGSRASRPETVYIFALNLL